ncbi:MAG: tetratricopeptide repeat protein [Anaerolineales bacterium]|jgi:tetratricopeptide (TPR) repeat protein
MTEATSEPSALKDLTVLQQELKKKPDDFESHTRLGWALYSLEKYDEAAATFKRAFDRWPNEIEVNYGLGLTLKMQGHRDEALESFKRAESVEPNSVRSSMMNTLAAEQKEYLLQNT